MAKMSTDELIDAFKELTLIELSELVKKFEETFEVTAAAPVAVAAAGGGAAVEEEEEKTDFDVMLTSAGEKKIQVIKEVRALTNLGQGGQGARRERSGRHPRGCDQGCGRRGQGEARGGRCLRRAEVS